MAREFLGLAPLTQPNLRAHIIVLVCFFASRRRHTRLQGDWSSDVCSSDLGGEDGERGCGGRPAGWQMHRVLLGVGPLHTGLVRLRWRQGGTGLADLCHRERAGRIKKRGQTSSAARRRRPSRRGMTVATAQIEKTPATADRKSTRLNSSHLVISYAV